MLGKVHALPVKSKKQKAKNRFFNYLIVGDDFNNTIVRQRTDKGIWHNLYEFPLIETLQDEDIDVLQEIQSFDNEILSFQPINHTRIIHKLTHQHLHIKFWKVRVRGSVNGAISTDDMRDLPFPVVLFNFIEKHWQ
jgi:A/G-specific adenine glycosylase